MKSTVATLLCLFAPLASGFVSNQTPCNAAFRPQSKPTSTSLSVDTQTLMGGGIAIAGLVAGVGFLAFAESMGERAKERGVGLSDSMATKIVGGLMEDVEVDAVGDLSSLTDKLEAALKETGGADAKELEMSEEDKKRIAEEADDGW